MADAAVACRTLAVSIGMQNRPVLAQKMYLVLEWGAMIVAETCSWVDLDRTLEVAVSYPLSVPPSWAEPVVP